MNFFRGLFWASILSLCLWAIILSCSYSMIAEVDLREEKVIHRKEYIAWWTERDVMVNKGERGK